MTTAVSESDFIDLLKKSKDLLDAKAVDDRNYFISRSPKDFEVDVLEAMKVAKRFVDFEGTIRLSERNKFPDIITEHRYGVEVKSVKSNKWTSTGNSVLEGSRVEGIDHVYIFFGILTEQPDFVFKKYEDCLYQIAVTHSPRYLIDMRLAPDDTIFSKLNLSYSELRGQENPVKTIMTHLKQIHSGQTLWWLYDDEAQNTFEPYIKYWSDIQNRTLKNELTAEIYVRFPEILSLGSTKFKRGATWLVSKHGIVDHAFRDKFSAGGRVDINVDGYTYHRVPKQFQNFKALLPSILQVLKRIPANDLIEDWNCQVQDDDKLSIWIEKISLEARAQLPNEAIKVLYHILATTIDRLEWPPVLSDEVTHYHLIIR